jgi:hypothetical protein
VSGLKSNLIPFPAQRIASPDLSALLAEGMTAAEVADLIAFTNADVKTQSRLINERTREPNAARRFTYRLWLVRRVLAQIDWSKAVVYNDARTPPKVILVNAADIEPEPVEWLWRDWLQCRAFNLIAGKPGVAKSTIALSFCAAVTSGGVWPDGHAFGDPYRAVYWSGEDGVRDTLLPRFVAAGGERENMRFVQGISDNGKKRPFDPARDMPALEQAITTLGDVRLVVIDPIALMVRGDSYKNVETRVGLQPLADLCAKIGACGLGVHHLTKNTAGGDPLDRISGSLAFGALARCVLVATRDINAGKGARRALMRVKVSNGPDWGGFDYKLDYSPLEKWPAICAQRVEWGDRIEGTAREILAKFEGKPVGQQQRKAALFLTAKLANGPQLAAEVIAEAAKAGIAERTLRYAFKALGGVPEKQGFGKSAFWIWELPEGTMQ